MEHHQIYRHKKFDMVRKIEKCDLQLKEELISRSGTPCTSRSPFEEANQSISLGFSDQDADFSPLPKRRRLGSSSSSVSYQSASPIITEAIQGIFKYHVNMVRKFPKKERSPKDQERRNKNTIACRMSRRKKKFDDLQIEQQYKECSDEHLKIAEQSLRARVYLNHLKQLVKQEDHPLVSSRRVPEENTKSNFSIDYLIGGIKQEHA
ncbi:protein Mabiki [Drosophila sechellia]|uniref:GM25716 n=1 Tax=Drosophila sechellia TaxID=7238 RepID=B4IEH8_DROSE|nr:protein Mabiki [Drosophila sechellia]EDW46005.1 GM25716 [Drosophila sechellia]